MRLSALTRHAEPSHDDTSYVYIALPADAASRLPTAPENPHITVLFLGQLDPKHDREVTRTLQQVVRAQPPMRAQLSGYGRFRKGPDGVPYFCTVDAPGLTHLQADIERALTQAGIANGSEHGYFPHCTLGYAESAEEIGWPTTDDDLPEFEINELHLETPRGRQAFKLQGARK